MISLSSQIHLDTSEAMLGHKNAGDFPNKSTSLPSKLLNYYIVYKNT